MISKPCHGKSVTGFFAFENTRKRNEGSMGSNILWRKYKKLNNHERRTTVKKVAAASFFAMLSIPTMMVDPIVKTIVRMLTLHVGI